MSGESRPVSNFNSAYSSDRQPNVIDASTRPGQSPPEQQRSTYDQTTAQSPCFIHSHLSNRREPSSIESAASTSHDTQASGSGSNSSHAREGHASSSTSTSSRSTTTRNRPEPRHRAAQGAVEPESESEGESGSDASTHRKGSSASYSGSGSETSEDESDRVRSLTRQLAETAVGVREMSKQLGRATVKSTIQSVLIITKARDNHLIKLTRELAIWLMDTPRNGNDTGLVVYVDAQLRQSKRFDADGIRRDYPHLFVPITSRRTSLFEPEAESNGRKSSDTGSGSSTRLNSMSHAREESQLRYWTSDMCSRSPHLFDFVVTLGGDGTVLFCSWLFQRIVPPVLPFALGSLGFLTNFDYSDYKKVLKSALDTGIRVNLRMRFTATVYRATSPGSTTIDRKKRRAIRSGKTGEIIMRTIQEGGWDRLESSKPLHQDLRGTFTEAKQAQNANEDRPAPKTGPAPEEKEESDHRGSGKGNKRDKEVLCFSTRPVETFEVLNDLVVDRGPSPYVSQLEVFGDEHHMTTAQADGLCISTPTGSTAYSLSAGGSLVHPEIPAILITPICPHTLSFRPMLLPDSMELRIAVPYNSRSTAWASFDGRGRVELKQGDHIKVTASRYPFPTVCAENQSIDWFQSISRTLKWNERQRQKSFVVLEEGEHEQKHRAKEEKSQASKKSVEDDLNADRQAKMQVPEKVAKDEEDDDADADEQEEEEEAFDIDDTSTVATRVNSPDIDKERHHHSHHHRRHSSHGNGRSSKSGSSTPLSSASSLIVNGLQPLTMTKTSSSDSREGSDNVPRNKRNGVTFEDSGASLNASNKIESKSGAEIKEEDRQDAGQQDSNDSAASSSNGHSLLHSPDRFGLAGPPMPPRALSERHLACADFRLDGGKEEDPNEQQLAPTQQQSSSVNPTEKKKSRSRSNSKRESAGAAPRVVEDDPLEQTRAPLLEPEGPSRAASHLYKKLRGKTSSKRSSSGDAKVFDGLDFSSNSSRGKGAALVVYGQDESDSDSTAEG